MTKQAKYRTVFVKCLLVNSEGDPVDLHGEMIAGRRNAKPCYIWEKRCKPMAWLNNPTKRKLWKEAP